MRFEHHARRGYKLCLDAILSGMGIHSAAHRHLRRRTGGKRSGLRGRVQKSFHAKRYQLLYREFGRRRFHGHTDMLAADRSMGRDGDVVLGPSDV